MLSDEEPTSPVSTQLVTPATKFTRSFSLKLAFAVTIALIGVVLIGALIAKSGKSTATAKIASSATATTTVISVAATSTQTLPATSTVIATSVTVIHQSTATPIKQPTATRPPAPTPTTTLPSLVVTLDGSGNFNYANDPTVTCGTATQKGIYPPIKFVNNWGQDLIWSISATYGGNFDGSVAFSPAGDVMLVNNASQLITITDLPVATTSISSTANSSTSATSLLNSYIPVLPNRGAYTGIFITIGYKTTDPRDPARHYIANPITYHCSNL